MKVSNCCGVEPKIYNGPHGTPDSDSMDHQICPECSEHCDYISLEQFCNEQGIKVYKEPSMETPLGEHIDSQGEIE